jgi:hypothetical protein
MGAALPVLLFGAFVRLPKPLLALLDCSYSVLAILNVPSDFSVSDTSFLQALTFWSITSSEGPNVCLTVPLDGVLELFCMTGCFGFEADIFCLASLEGAILCGTTGLEEDILSLERNGEK